MKVLFYFNHTIIPNQGGVERITSLLGDFFEKKNIQTFYLSDDCCQRNKLAKNNLFFITKGGLSQAINRQYLEKIIEEYSIDIIINQAGIFPCSTPLVKLKGKAKLLTVMHNTLDGMYSYPNLPIKDPLFLKLMLSKPFQRIYNVMFYVKYHNYLRYLCAGSDVVILISDKYKYEIQKYCSPIDTKIISIPNALTLPRVYSFDKKDKEILFVGRLEWQKRPDLLLNIWKAFSQRNPEWHLSILGDGTYKKIIEKRIQREKIANITLLGFKDPIPYYKKAYVLCMTSCYESFGLVLLEAMNYGVIPIAFDTFPNLKDIITDGIDGYIIPPFNVNRYVQVLESLCTNTKQSELMRKQSMKKLDFYSIENIGNQWIQLFNQILK